MKRAEITGILLCFLLLLAGCGGKTDVRPVGGETDRTGFIFPEYYDVTIPCNIAPLNFYYTEPEGKHFVTTFTAGEQSFRLKGREVCWKEKDWARLLSAHTDIRVESSYLAGGRQESFTWVIHVSEDRIDPCLTYRLIEPGF